MPQNDLYIKLKEAYSEQNLNHITSKIITWYKDKQYSRLKRLVEAVSQYVDLGDESINKSFSKLIFLYHPDKGHQYRTELDSIRTSGKTKEYEKYSHIFLVQDVENIPLTEDEDFDIDYSPEYVMDEDLPGFSYFDGAYPQSDDLKSDFSDYDYDNTFFSAVKRKFYNSLSVDLPAYYLEDLEEIEMTSYDICDLTGIEHCRQAVFVDLSDNCITDISELGRLLMIEELYLSNNEIGYIDDVSNLLKLRVIDLSNNSIDDLTPLLDLPDLEYVNVVGNPVSKQQIEQLKNNGVLVVN